MKLYLDTSVFGGYFETEFKIWTEKLFEQIINGDYTAVISDITLLELEGAPKYIRDLADKIISENAELVTAKLTDKKLSDIYIKEKIVSSKYRSDTFHIAIATTNKVDILTSWNFKHIVNINKIRQYNSVNLKYGFTMIEIRSPRDIIII